MQSFFVEQPLNSFLLKPVPPINGHIASEVYIVDKVGLCVTSQNTGPQCGVT